MFQNCLVRYFEYNYFNIRNQFYIAAKTYNPDAIHDLRVEIKQLRAYFQLIEWINPSFSYKDNFRYIKKLFKSAGTVRDLQVQAELTSEWQTRLNVNLDDYSKLLEQREIAAKLDFARFCKRYKLKNLKSKRKNLEQALENISLGFAKIRANDRVQFQIREMITFGHMAPKSDEPLHKIRALAKQARYTFNILEKCSLRTDFPKTITDELKNIHHALGEWHDHELALEFLDNFKNNFSRYSPIDEKQFSALKRTIGKEKESLRSEFSKLWGEFVKQYQ